MVFRGASLFDTIDMGRGEGLDPADIHNMVAFEKCRSKPGRWTWKTGHCDDSTEPVREDIDYDGFADHLAIQS